MGIYSLCTVVIWLLLVCLSSTSFGDASNEKLDYLAKALHDYPSNDGLKVWVHSFASRCRSISKVHTLGKSVQGRPIYAIEISDNPGTLEAEPNVKMVGNIHGDEPLGRVFLPALAEWLCREYKVKDPDAIRIVDDMHLWLVPSLNPDGFALRMRENANGIDLNRDFPDPILNPSMKPSGKEQPETKAIMKWINPPSTALTKPTANSPSRRFIASLAMHEGALVANYPWDGAVTGMKQYNGTADDATYRFLASYYATKHTKMADDNNPEFPNAGGITNGAHWYSVYGGMQDYNYLIGRCFELTLELSNNKYPPAGTLTNLWKDNFEALTQWPIQAAFGGLRGRVYREMSARKIIGGRGRKPVSGATIELAIPASKFEKEEEKGVGGRGKKRQGGNTLYGSPLVAKTYGIYGDFYRPLAPGRYKVRVSKRGFTPQITTITVPDNGEGLVKNFYLRSDGILSSWFYSTTSSSKDDDDDDDDDDGFSVLNGDDSDDMDDYDIGAMNGEVSMPFNSPLPRSAVLLLLFSFLGGFWLVKGRLRRSYGLLLRGNGGGGRDMDV